MPWAEQLTFKKARESVWARLPYLAPVLGFAAPLLVFIGLDLDGYDPARSHHLPEITNQTMPDALSPARYVGWVAFLTALFLAYQAAHLWGLGVPSRLTPASGGEALTRLLYDGSLLFVVAGVRDKLYWAEERVPDGVFVGLVALYSLAFSVAFRISEEGKRGEGKIEVKCATLTPGKLLFVVLPALGVVLTAVVYHLMTAWRVSPAFFYLYLTVVLLVVVGHAAFWVTDHLWASFGGRFHLHHWYWGLLCAHACVFNTDASLVCQAAFVAVYAHGVSVFGPTSIFEDEAPGPKYVPPGTGETNV